MLNFTNQLFLSVQEAIEQNNDLLPLIREKRFTVSDTGLTYRKINFLAERNLIPDARDTNSEWRKFSLYDLFYINYLLIVRDLYHNDEKLKDIYDTFYTKRFDHGLTDSPLFCGEYLFLGSLIGIPMGILLFKSGKIGLTDTFNRTMFIRENENEDPIITCIMLSDSDDATGKVTLFRNKFDFKEIKYSYEHPNPEINKKERSLLGYIRNNKYSKITITKKSNGEFLIEGENFSKANSITVEDIQKIMSEKNFGSITLNFEGSKITNIEDSDKYKF